MSGAATPRAGAADAALDGPIAVTLKLGEFDVQFRNGAWFGRAPGAEPVVTRPTVDAEEAQALQKQVDELKARLVAQESEKNVLVFKNRLLTEMVRGICGVNAQYYGPDPRTSCANQWHCCDFAEHAPGVSAVQLAVSQLDCKKRDEELATERLRVEALKWKITTDRRDSLKL